MDTKVPEPDAWAEIAAELRRIADDAEKLIGEPAPSTFQINVQPLPHNCAAAAVAVDTIALALLGKPGTTKRMGDGAYHRDAVGRRGPIPLSVFRRIPGPEHAELERLRARVAELEARDDGQSFSREADDPTPVSGRVPPHTGGMTDQGLVDETVTLIRCGCGPEHGTQCTQGL